MRRISLAVLILALFGCGHSEDEWQAQLAKYDALAQKHAATEAARAGAVYLSIRPVARNAAAMACFHRVGFRLLGHIEMFRQLGEAETGGDRSRWQEGIAIHGLEFRC